MNPSRAAWLGTLLAILVATAGSDGGPGKKPPVAAEVSVAEGLLSPDPYLATYRVTVTEKHPDFAKGEEVQIYLSAETKVLLGKGKDAKAGKATGWSKGTKVFIDRYDGIQQSKPPQIHPLLIVIAAPDPAAPPPK